MKGLVVAAAGAATLGLLAGVLSPEPPGRVLVIGPSPATGRPETFVGLDVEPSAAVVPPPGCSSTLHAVCGVRALGRFLRISRRPGLRTRWLLRARNPLGQRLAVLATGDRLIGGERWRRILLPVRPNGRSGWVRDAEVQLVTLRERIEIDLSEYRLKHYRGDRLIHSFRVGVGQDRWPTPVGRFYVWADVALADPGGPYGTHALGLSGFSPVLSDWPGGGRAAIHGTADPSDVGRKISHGCIRVFNADMEKLTRVPMGTPVIIRR